MLTSAKFSLLVLCERVSSGAEVLNAASGLALSVAALYGLIAWLRTSHRDRSVLLLILMALMIGPSSSAFHWSPSTTTLMLDTIPTQVFVLSSFAFILYRMLGFDALVTLLNMAAFILVSSLFSMAVPPDSINGGAHFIAPLIAIYILGAGLIVVARFGMHHDQSLTAAAAARSDAVHIPRLRAGWGLLQVGILFAVAIVARSLDMPLCSSLPYGTHFIWHILMACSVGKLLSVILEFVSARQRAAALATP